MAGSANTVRPQTAFPWPEILVANGFVGLLLGLIVLYLTGQYAGALHLWAQGATAEQFAGLVRVGVLVYILYALVMLGSGMTWIALAVYRQRRQQPDTPPAQEQPAPAEKPVVPDLEAINSATPEVPRTPEQV